MTPEKKAKAFLVECAIVDAGWFCYPRHFIRSVIVFVCWHAEALDDTNARELDKSARPDERQKTDKQSGYQVRHALAITFCLCGMGKNGHVDNDEHK